MAIDEAECVLNRINEQIRARESFDRLAALSQDLWVGSGRLCVPVPRGRVDAEADNVL